MKQNDLVFGQIRAFTVLLMAW